MKYEGLADKSIITYLKTLERLTRNLDTDLEKLNEADVKGILSNILDRDMSESSKFNHKMALRKFLKSTGQDQFLDMIKLKKSRSLSKIPEDLLTKNEVERIIDAAANPRDRAMFAVLYESGGRIGELRSMQVKHVSFDDNGAVLTFPQSKTGARRVRIVFASSYLRQWLESHPTKEKPDSPLWRSLTLDTVVAYTTIVTQIKAAAKRAGINKRIYPHLFRHSRATHLAEHLTEQQMKNYLGWTPNSNMASIYVHLSGKDIDKAILQMNGIDIGGDAIDPLQPDRCPRCHELNPPKAKYCMKCGLVLSKEEEEDVDKTIVTIIEKLKENPDILMKALSELNAGA